MPSEKEIIAYIDKRVGIYKAAQEVMATRRAAEPSRSARYASQEAAFKSSAQALEYVKYFIETGKEHDALTQKPVQSEKQEVVVEEAKPKGRGGRPRKPAADA